MAQRLGQGELIKHTERETASPAGRIEPTRREFLQVLIGGSTLMIGGVFLTREEAAALPGPGNSTEYVDIGDTLVLVETPYKYNLTLEVTPHNRVRFELPREDKGQGIATTFAMVIAEEMDADYDRVDVELSDRRADRFTTITGGSSTVRTLYEPARTVAANARERLKIAAGLRWGVLPTELTTKMSMVMHPPTGRAANYGELSAEAAALNLPVLPLPLKPVSEHTIIGTSKGRKNARAIVTGEQKYAMDLGPDEGVPGNALPAVIARPPDIKGHVVSINNLAAVQAMPGVVGVVQIDLPDRGPVPLGASFPQSTGVAVAAQTFHHALAARDALNITWAPGPLAGTSDADIKAVLESINLPLTPALPGVESLDASFDFPYAAHAALEVMNAVAHVHGNSATIWYPSQTPNYQAGQIAAAIGIPEANVTMHIPFAGGAFGRHLFGESAIEAALISQALNKPIKLMWTRNDDMRHGRFRPMTHHDLRAMWLGGLMLSYEHRIASAEMDLRHGYGDLFLGAGYSGAHLAIEEAVFNGTVSVPYEFGITSQLMIPQRFEVPTGSWRSIYAGWTNCANEIFVDEIARAHGIDEVAFRLAHTTLGAGSSLSREGGRDGLVGPADARGPCPGRGARRRVPLRGRLPRRDRHHGPRAAPHARVLRRRRGRSDQQEGPRSADAGRADRQLVRDVPRGQPPRQRDDPREQLPQLPVGTYEPHAAHDRGARLRRDARHARGRRRTRHPVRVGRVRERVRARHRYPPAPLPDPGIPSDLRLARCPYTT